LFITLSWNYLLAACHRGKNMAATNMFMLL